jgi:hypothetical protein
MRAVFRTIPLGMRVLMFTASCFAIAAALTCAVAMSAGAQPPGPRVTSEAPRCADETTPLSPAEEVAFQRWAKRLGIVPDVPGTFYDYRGAFVNKETPDSDGLWSDRYMQHGHPQFSRESMYARRDDTARWVPGDVRGAQVYVPDPTPTPACTRGGPPELPGPSPYLNP